MKRFLKTTLVVAAFVATLGFVGYRVARASLLDRVWNVSRAMAPYLDDPRNAERPRQIYLNGVRLYLASGETPAPPSAVRAFYANRYAAGAAAPRNEYSFGTDDDGGLVALDFGEDLSVGTLRRRIGRFRESGNLGDMAQMRYVYCRRTRTGGTHYLTVWTDEHFSLNNLLPTAEGDTPGDDLEGMPRYPGLRRIMSAGEKGVPLQMAIYNGDGASETVATFYDAQLQSLGWRPDDRFNAAADRAGRASERFISPAGHEIMVSIRDASPKAGSPRVSVTLLESR